MSCSVCTCTHHLAWHGDPDSPVIGPCTVGDCGCADFKVLDVTAWAKVRPLRAHLTKGET